MHAIQWQDDLRPRLLREVVLNVQGQAAFGGADLVRVVRALREALAVGAARRGLPVCVDLHADDIRHCFALRAHQTRH